MVTGVYLNTLLQSDICSYSAVVGQVIYFDKNAYDVYCERDILNNLCIPLLHSPRLK